MVDIKRIIRAIERGRTKLDKLTFGFSRNPFSGSLSQCQRFIDLLSYLDENLQLLVAIPDKVIREKNAKILLKIREENRLVDLMPDGNILYRLEDMDYELESLLEAITDTDLVTTRITEKEQPPKAEHPTETGGGKARQRSQKKRRKTPPQLLKESRERQAVQELAKDSNITAKKLGEILGCDASTVVRLEAWKNKHALNSNLPNGFIKRNEDGETSIEAIAPDK